MDYKEIFDRYLDGRLSGEELNEFEKLLSEDPGLAGELDQYKKLHSASEKIISGDSDQSGLKYDDKTDQQARDDIADYKNKDVSTDTDIKEFEHVLKEAGEDDSRGRGKSRKISPIWYAAAVLLVGAVTIAFIMTIRGEASMPEMYAKYYEPYRQSEKIFEITRSNDDLYFAVQLFESEDYIRAGLLFEQLADSLSFTEYSHFYSGLIFIQQEKWELAIEAFQQVISSGEGDIMIEARWYLGLCYLKVENGTAAREQFVFLSETKNRYSKRALKIIRHLD